METDTVTVIGKKRKHVYATSKPAGGFYLPSRTSVIRRRKIGDIPVMSVASIKVHQEHSD